MSIRYIRQSDMLKCHFAIMDPSHYRDDGTCKCDDAEHRAMMCSDWGYDADDFNDIPLRLSIPAPDLIVLDEAIQQVTHTPLDTQYELQEAIDNLRLVWSQINVV